MTGIRQAQQAVDELIKATYADHRDRGASEAQALQATARYVGVNQARVRAVIEAPIAAVLLARGNGLTEEKLTEEWERGPLRAFGLGLKQVMDAQAAEYATNPELRAQIVDEIRTELYHSDPDADEGKYDDYEPLDDEITARCHEQVWIWDLDKMMDAHEDAWGPWGEHS